MGEAGVDEQAIAAHLRRTFRPWDPHAVEPFATYGAEPLVRHEAHRIAQTLALLDKAEPPPQRVLEIGTGYLTMAVTLRHWFPEAEIVGLEHPHRPYVWMPEYQQQLIAERIRLVTADVAAFGSPFRAGSFNLVVLAEVVEHIPPHAIPAALKEIKRSLSPDGVLLLTTPNLAAWTNRELLLRGDSPQQCPAQTIDGTYPHLRLYTMAELVALLDSAGFRVVRQTFMDQVALGMTRVRHLLRTMLCPVRFCWPALRDTCLIRAVSLGRVS